MPDLTPALTAVTPSDVAALFDEITAVLTAVAEPDPDPADIADIDDVDEVDGDDEYGRPETLTVGGAQGDLLVITTAAPLTPPRTGHPTPGDGVTLLDTGRSHARHVLHGPVTWAPATGGTWCQLGVITVPPGAVGVVTHDGEHDDLRLGPGQWTVHRQRSLD